jgi:hypothetical protein
MAILQTRKWLFCELKIAVVKNAIKMHNNCKKATVFIIGLFEKDKNKLETSCIGHYWPIVSESVNDKMTGKNASSSLPSFKEDRFGSVNGAIDVSTNQKGWHLPNDFYFLGDTTVTLWLKKLTCEEQPIGFLFMFFFYYIIVLALGATRVHSDPTDPGSSRYMGLQLIRSAY